MKYNLGFYTGQVDEFAIVKDEEPHKIIYLINIYFKQTRNETYIRLPADGLMIDLADVAITLVKRIDL